ncbi:uncharacterized protein N0V89_012572 [Didymosphaeria variabile]|uniref:Uncharacterized protein n=1 Tax=Didymosphaeria variabile TaxID=1932322 RepID=A0A9W8X9H0_9PLEO|nr:uncharacterized protein N0V89_012572 [Didymosphaeria variabile]KAJ4344828.1 hypothetical protein N0V89_012572 [Didymosphaeria variabile]
MTSSCIRQFENCKMAPNPYSPKGASNTQTERIAEDKKGSGKTGSVTATPASHIDGVASSVPSDTSNLPVLAYDADAESFDEDEPERPKPTKPSAQTEYDPFNYQTHYGQQPIVLDSSVDNISTHDSNDEEVEHSMEVGSEQMLDEENHGHNALQNAIVEDDLADDMWAALSLPTENRANNEYNDSLFDASDDGKEEPQRSKSLLQGDSTGNTTTGNTTLVTAAGAPGFKATHDSDKAHESFQQNVPDEPKTTASAQEQPALTTPGALGAGKKRKKKSKAQKNAEKARAAQGHKDQIDLQSLQNKAAKEQEEVSKKREKDRAWAEYSTSLGVNGAGMYNFSNEEASVSEEQQPEDGGTNKSPSDDTGPPPKLQEDRDQVPTPILTQDPADIEPVSWYTSNGDYAYRIVFKSTEVPVDAIYLELKDQGELEWHAAGERKLKVDGQLSKKYWKEDGAHLTKSFLRKNAAAKLIEWRDSRKVSSLGEDVRHKLRERVHVTLDMGPPNGPLGDAAFFAESIATLRKRLQTLPKWLPQADFLLKLAVPNDIFVKHPLERSGFLKYWDEVRDTLLTFPTRFKVGLTDSSITDARLNEWWDENDKDELDRRVNKALTELHAPVDVKLFHEQNLEMTTGFGKDKKSVKKHADLASTTTALPTIVQGVDAMLSYFGYNEKSLKSRIEAEMSQALQMERQECKKGGGDPSKIRFDDNLLNQRVDAEIAEFEDMRRAEIVEKCKSTLLTSESVETAIKQGTRFVEDLQYFQQYRKLPERSDPVPDPVQVTFPAAQIPATRPSSKPARGKQDQPGPGAHKLGIWIPQKKTDGSFAVKRYERKTQKILLEIMNQRWLPTEEFRTKLERAAVIAADDAGIFWTAYNNAKAEDNKDPEEDLAIAPQNSNFDHSHSFSQDRYTNQALLAGMPTVDSFGTLDMDLLPARVPGAGLQNSIDPAFLPHQNQASPPQRNQSSNQSQMPEFPLGLHSDYYPSVAPAHGVRPAPNLQYTSQGDVASQNDSSNKPPAAPGQPSSALSSTYNVKAQYVRGRFEALSENTTMQNNIPMPPTAFSVGPEQRRGKKRDRTEYNEAGNEDQINDRVFKKHAGERNGSYSLDVPVKPLNGHVLESQGHPPSNLGKRNRHGDPDPSERPKKKPALSIADATSAAPRRVLRPQSPQGYRIRVDSATETLRPAPGRSAFQEPLLPGNINMTHQPTTEQDIQNANNINHHQHGFRPIDQMPIQEPDFQLDEEDWLFLNAEIEDPHHHHEQQYGASQPGSEQ